MSLIMFFSILPDVDIVFRLLGVDLGHRSITHSMLISTIVWSVVLIKYRKPSVMVYFIAYLSHIIIGDLLIGPLNLLYPFGQYFVNGVADFKTSEHLVIEGVLLLIMATMVFGQYLRDRRVHIFPFEFTKLDSLFYPIVFSALIISLFFLLDQSQIELTQFPNSIFLLIQSPIDQEMATIIVMHAFGIAIVSFLWIVSRRNTQFQSRYQKPQKQQRQRL
jgi:membrane-bound metal-dependent hydrolase YbcI (DUF457 family)